MVSVQIEIDAVTPKLYAAYLGVSARTLTQWRSELSKILRKSEFDWLPHEPSISEKSQRVLSTYQQLIALLGKKKAKQHIKIYGV